MIARGMISQLKNVAAKITKINSYPCYFIEYGDNYKLDTLLNQGVSTVTELQNFVSTFLMNGENFSINTLNLGCSMFNCKTYSGTLLHARNMDIQKCGIAVVRTTSNNAYKSVATVPLRLLYADPTVIENNLAEQKKLKAIPLCVTDGMNEKGLCVSVAQCFGGNQNETGNYKGNILITIAVRLLLDKCANVNECISLLKEFNMHMIDTNYHLLISDANNNSVVVEWFNNTIAFTTVSTTSGILTNYLLTATASDTVKQGLDRYNTINGVMTTYSNILSDAKAKSTLQSVKQGTSDYGTIWSAIFNPSTLKATYWFAQDYNNPYVVSLNRKDMVTSVLPQETLDNSFATVVLKGKHVKVTLKQTFSSGAPLLVRLTNSISADTSAATIMAGMTTHADFASGNTLRTLISNYHDGATTYTELNFYNSSQAIVLKAMNSTVNSLHETDKSATIASVITGPILVCVGASGDVIEFDLQVNVNGSEIGNKVLV